MSSPINTLSPATADKQVLSVMGVASGQYVQASTVYAVGHVTTVVLVLHKVHAPASAQASLVQGVPTGVLHAMLSTKSTGAVHMQGLCMLTNASAQES
jgi:precorrin isomerase